MTTKNVENVDRRRRRNRRLAVSDGLTVGVHVLQTRKAFPGIGQGAAYMVGCRTLDRERGKPRHGSLTECGLRNGLNTQLRYC